VAGLEPSFQGLNAGFFVVGNDRDRIDWLLFRCRLFQDFHLAINAQHRGHLFRKVGIAGIALFQVVPHFVRFDLFLSQDLAHCALCQVGEARMSLRWSMLASVAGQKPRRPQFVRIAEVLRLPASQRHQPRLGFKRDRRLSAGPRAIVERSHRAFDDGALDAALDGLMMQPKPPTNRKKRRVFAISQQYPRPFNPACRLSPRLRYRSQLRRILVSERQFNRPTPRRHDLQRLLATRDLYGNPTSRDESLHCDNFYGIV
jgi:hypothetical protein